MAAAPDVLDNESAWWSSRASADSSASSLLRHWREIVMSADTAMRYELRELNVGIGVAERDHDTEFLRQVLDDELIFRRADGKVVGKDEYLAGLRNRTYERLDVEVVEVDEKSDSAVVTTIVTARGMTNGKPFGGTFRNVRTFVFGDGVWRCPMWINTRIGTGAAAIHHVSVPVSDLERSRRFYREIVGLREIRRPAFPFPGAWFALGTNQLHLIVGELSTFRGEKGLDSRDIHFAVRVRSYREAREFLESKGYTTDAEDLDLLKLKASPRPTAGFPQLYILDPDRNVIEFNAEALDSEEPES
jgi:glyoxylase I family protein